MVAYALLAALILAVGLPAFLFLPPRRALAVTTLLPPVLFQATNWIHLGYVDPFAPIAFVITAAISFVGALAPAFLVGRWHDMRARQR